MTSDEQTSATPAPVPVEELSFEAAQAELERVVEALEDRHTGLDEALTLWERGEALHAWCRSRLDHAAARMRKLTLTDEEIAAAAANPEDTFAPAGSIPVDAAADPAPASTPDDADSATIF